jgi:hypothetical protein
MGASISDKAAEAMPEKCICRRQPRSELIGQLRHEKLEVADQGFSDARATSR